MKTDPKSARGLSTAARRLLRTLLELDGTPIELHPWHAKNAKKIPLLEELRRHRMWDGSSHAHITFWGACQALRSRSSSGLGSHLAHLLRAGQGQPVERGLVYADPPQRNRVAFILTAVV